MSTDQPDGLSGYTSRIAEYTKEHGIACDRFERRGIAQILHSRQARMSDLDLERVFMHKDIVPPEAMKNITKDGGPAARRLGLVAA